MTKVEAADSDPGRWVEDFGPTMLRYALVKVGDAELAEELVQQALVKGYSRAEQFEGRSSEQTWLMTILRRAIADHFRQAKRKATVVDMADPRGVWARQAFDGKGIWQQRLSRWPRPDDALERKEFWDVLDLCMRKLPTGQAEAFVLRDVEALAPQQVQEVLGISQTNLHQRLHRARSRMRECLNSNWFNDEQTGGTNR